MSATFDNTFVTQWRNEVVRKFSREGSLLRDMVTVYPGVTGSTLKIHRVGGVAAQVGRARHSNLTAANIPHDDVTISMSDIYATDYIDDLDQLKTNATFRQSYTQELMDAVTRRIDQFVIDALNTTTTTELSISNAFNKAGLIAFNKALNLANVEKAERMAVISNGAEEDLLSDTQLTSRDFIRDSWLEKGYASNVMGMRLQTIVPNSSDSTGLPAGTGGSQTRIFAYPKKAVALAIGKEPTLTVKYIEEKDSWFISVKASVGSALVLPEGVMRASIAD